MSGWMIYAALTGVLLSLAAMAAESLLRSWGRPARWVWMGALAGTAAIPFLSLVRSAVGSTLGASTAAAAGGGSAPAPGVVGESARGGLGAVVQALADAAASYVPPDIVDPYILPAWAAGSGVLALASVVGLVRLARRARAWPGARVSDTDVLLSEDVGPAAVGLRRPRVVIPRWMLALEPERLRLAVWHEEAHRSAGDPQMLLAGLAAVVLAPWNPALWWQHRRLRAAVELDCDTRVLGRGAPRHLYGSLLLDVGTGATRPGLLVAALLGHPSVLERRLIMIGRGTPRRGRLATAALGATAVLAVALACEAAPPTEPMTDGGRTRAAGAALERAATKAARERAVASGRLIQEIAEDAVRKNDVGPAEVVRNVRLRAVGGASEEPLIYVDRVRLSTGAGLDQLDPDAIERIEVIKGGAAERLFGPEGANGVIQIYLDGERQDSTERRDEREGGRPERR